MNCPRCNVAVAFTKNRCDNCGQELRSYRKTVSLSNSFYNLALSQAKVRDLSGAIVSLKQSLQFNKLNTSARNLLGLIYYEEGEIVAALSEWVLSKHYQDKDNDAEEYIREVQSNPNKLDTYNQTIKKYNTALQAAKHGDDDMAIIQLKKVVNLNPNFIRASQLLALLYMKTERRDNRARAYRLMRAAHKIDVTNTTTIRYLKELSDMKNKSSDPVVKAVEKEQENAKKASKLPSVEMYAYKTITPYKEERPSVMPFVNIIIGVIIGLAVMYFLVIPHMRATLASNANKNFKQYSENQAASDSDLSTLKDQNKSLKSQVEELQNKIKDLQGGDPTQVSGVQEVYDALIGAYDDYQKNKKADAADKLVKINADRLTSDVAKSCYDKIKKATYATATKKYFEEGRDAYNGTGSYSKKDYDKSIKLLEKSLSFDENNTDAIYFLGRCYQQKSDVEKAKSYYNKIVDNYPDSKRVSEAKRRLRELGE